MKQLLFPALAFLYSASLYTPAHAQPELSGSVLIEIQNDWTYSSDDEGAETNTLFTKTEPYLNLAFTDTLSLEAAMVLEPVQATDPGDDTIFANEGLFFEELKLSYSDDHYGVFAGKFNPNFATAWDLAPGIYGPDFAEDYELTERIGFGASYSLATQNTGTHTISASSFFLDTSALSGSFITRRGKTDKSDGGVSNTEDFSSYALALDSENAAGLEGLNTHIGHYNQSEGDADTGLDNETGYALSAYYSLPLTDTVDAMVLGEWVGILNLEGSEDDIAYLTASAGLEWENGWNLAASYTDRDTDAQNGNDIEDYMYQISTGYTFANGISADIAYRGSEESNVDTHMLGAMIAYSYDF